MTVGSSSTSTITPGTSIELGQSNQELVGSKGRSGLQKFALLAGGALIGAVIAVLILLAVSHGQANQLTSATAAANASDAPDVVGSARRRPPANAQLLGPSLTTSQFLRSMYYPGRSNGTWLSATELLYRDELGNLVTFDVRQQRTTVVLEASVGDLMHSTEVRLSADRRYALVAKNVQHIFRHSSFALYDAIDLRTHTVHPISLTANTSDFLQLVEWSTAGNALVFVHANNIYYQPNVTAPAVQLTDDGGRSITYGTCDWVYEEEIFASKTALWFSPDGRRLAFVRFDDTRVPVMNIPVYGEPGRRESAYPQAIALHYPKVGAPNPLVSLATVDLHTATRPQQTVLRHEQAVPAELAAEEHIIAAVGWQSNDTFASAWMNRVQNRAVVQTCRDSVCQPFKRIRSPDGWVDLFKPLQFGADGAQMLLIVAHEQFASDGRSLGRFRHVTLVSTADGSETALTAGPFEVTHILHWDAAVGRVFYAANRPDRPEVQHVYAVRTLAGSASDCLTCGMRASNGANQTFFTADFSRGRHAVVSSEGPDVPEVGLYEWTVNNATGGGAVQLQRIAWLERNDDLKMGLAGVPLPTVTYVDVPLDSGENFTARVRIMVPANADRSGRTKYAMLVNVYGGPDTFNGNDRFEVSWGSVMVQERQIVHVQINGRGSGLRGDRLRHAIYRRFGQVEVDDQIEVAQKLAKLLPFVDAERVAIWGWSYGGFAAALALAKDGAHVFRCAASVAPVTDFTLYDSIYTERFMGLDTVDDNAAGYAATRVSALPEQFRNRTFMLIHGTFDDNVHYQQSMALSRSLELHDVMFRQMSYPDEGHSLASVQKHLYHTLGGYFDECFA